MSCKTATSGRPAPAVARFFPILGFGSNAALGAGSLEKLQQFPLDGLVARHHAALVEHPVLALCVAHECAGFAQHHNPRSKIPGMEIALPEAIEPARSRPGEVECSGAKPFNEEIMRRLAAMRDAGADHRRRQLRPRRDPDAAIVEEGAFALLGGECLLICRIEDEPRHELALALERDRDGEDRNAMEKIGGAVERINNPVMGAIYARDVAALLHEEAVARTRSTKLGEQNFLGAVISGADEICGAFKRDLKLFDLAEIAREAAASLAGGGEHDVHQR